MGIFGNKKVVSGVVYVKNEHTALEFKDLETRLKKVCEVVHAMPNDFAHDIDAKYCFWIKTDSHNIDWIKKDPIVLKVEVQ